MLRIFPKPNLTPEKQKENLEVDINRLQIKFERLVGDYNAKEAILTDEFQTKEARYGRILLELDSELVVKRQERSELEKPLVEREHIVSVKESEVKRLFLELEDKLEELNIREDNIRSKEDTVENFADDLGEKKADVNRRLKNVERKEDILKQKELDYLLKVDTQNGLFKEKEEALQERSGKIDLLYIQVQATKENVDEREKDLQKREKLLKDRYETLERSIKRI